MSGIAGIVRLDGRPVQLPDLESMTSTMTHRGPDGINHWTSGSVGLAHCLFRTTPQSLHESQPVYDSNLDVCLTMDGRLDNRVDLAAALGEPRYAQSESSDSELVMRGYEKWGADVLPRLMGDFSFALWDGTRRRLLCGRDFLGKRPFYYARTPEAFRFASEPQAVLADPSVPREPNPGMIGEFLSLQVTSTTETLYLDLLRLPPAHFLTATRDGVEIRRYWDWDPSAEIRYARDSDYAEHLLELFTSAVEVRLSSSGPLAASLSGGVDSSSVLAVTEQVRPRLGTAPLEIYGMVYPGLPCDESSFIRAVARHLHIAVREVHPRAVGREPYLSQTDKYLDLPDYPNVMMHRQYWTDATDRGCRVLLTGKGPDEWLAGSYYSIADHLRRGRLGELTAQLRSDAGSDRRARARHLLSYGVKPVLPPSLVRVLRQATRRTARPTFMTPEFSSAICLEDRVRALPPRGTRLATADLAGGLDGGWHVHGNEFDERASASVGLEERYPLDDRRIIEFALALPESQRQRGWMTKFVLRTAMAGLIPDAVRLRPDKADYSHTLADELLEQGGISLFQDLEMAQRGWIERDQVLEMFHSFERDYTAGRARYRRRLWELWLIVSLERWLAVA